MGVYGLAWEPIIFILHVCAPILETLYSKYTSEILGHSPFVNGQLAGITTIKSVHFWRTLNY